MFGFNFNPFSNAIFNLINHNKSFARSILKGSSYLKKKNKFFLINDIKNIVFVETKLSANIKKNHPIFYDIDNPELSIKQFVSSIFGKIAFNQALLNFYSKKNKKIFYPMPAEFLNKLSKQNIKVNYVLSLSIWYLILTFFYFKGILYYFKILFSFLFKKNICTNHSIVLANITLEPINSINKSNYNFFNWLINYYKKEKLDTIYHNLNIVEKNLGKVKIIGSYEKYLFQLNNFYQFWSFLIYGIKIILYSFYELLRGHWWSPFMLSEGLRRKIINIKNENNLPKKILFSNINWFYRPIWTHLDTSKKNIKIILFFYSTNILHYRDSRSKSKYKNSDRWHLISWPHYLLWDKNQKTTIEKYDKNNLHTKEITGPIWWSDFHTISFSKFTKKINISVFDVQPLRRFVFCSLGMDYEYYTYELSKYFLNDIVNIFSGNQFNIIFKTKRKHLYTDKRYFNLIKNIDQRKNFQIVDNKISPFQIIKNSDIVISMPFTSTSLIAKDYLVKTFFYDPLKLIAKDDPALGGIDLVSGKKDLEIKYNKIVKLK
ncbi:MAG: hypothetical protein CMI96_00545 [Pelagibacteraceae bacterium]|nr:hypothetical protein [Pelagibacteraceae bacterium]